MSSVTPYSVRWRGPVLLPHSRAWDVSVAVEHAGASPTISAATFTLYTPDGAARVDAQAATIAGGTVSFSLNGSELAATDMGPRWLVKIEATISGATLPFYNDAAVCLAPLYPPVGTTDLTARYSKIADLQTTGASDLQTFITDAWGTLTQKMYADGLPFWAIRSPGALREWLLARSLELALDDLALLIENNSQYTTEARRLGGMLDALYEDIRSRMDTQGDNTLSTSHEGASAIVNLSSGPGFGRGRRRR